MGDYRMRPSEVIDLGDRVVIVDEIVGRGATSGARGTGQRCAVASTPHAVLPGLGCGVGCGARRGAVALCFSEQP
jgi:hypothetical protein